MNSKRISEDEAYVWIWLPNSRAPVVAGRISRDADQFQFNYGQSYLSRDNAIPLNAWELPLQSGFIPPLSELTLAGCLRDCSPDAWGRRVLLNYLSNDSKNVYEIDLPNELLFLLHSGSNRTGSLDFQRSATQYHSRINDHTTLPELIDSVHCVENAIPLTMQQDKALIYGSTIGGSRPKSQITANEKQYIAKFSSQTDTFPVAKSEYVAMRLATEVGLYIAPVQLINVDGEDVLLVERFDRIHSLHGWQRKTMLSALTLFELNQALSPYASYAELANIMQTEFSYPDSTKKELFGRLVFNILIGNTDDHARNHAAFWDGKQLHLTPAYDICPQERTHTEPTQAMRISDNRNSSRLDFCLECSPHFGLEYDEALQVTKHQIQVIKAKWELICDEAKLDQAERVTIRDLIFNPISIQGFEELVNS